MPIVQKDLYNDAYQNFYIVMEQTTPEDNKIQILSDGTKNGLNFLRFGTCLQAFNGPNRNHRDWKASQIRTMANDRPVQELITKGSFVGEAGHPVPMDGNVTVQRILTIDPLRTSHRITELSWPKPNEIHGVVETLDDGPGGPGNKMMRMILQGIEPAFSLRSLVPQRKEPNGIITVLGPGRMVCYDWVFLPSHEEAYRDVEIPIKNVIKQPEFNVVMESYCDFVMAHSDKLRGIVDTMEPALESASFDQTTGLMSVNTKQGRIFAAPELKYRREFKSLFEEM